MILFLATKNPGKVRELRAILAVQPWAANIQLHSAADHPDIPEPEETGATFAENARLKATYYAQATSHPSLADDSGLEVDALNGAPGVHSARYAPDELSRIAKLLRELEAATGSPVPDNPAPQHTARFRCAMALAAPDGVILAETTGTLEGHIAAPPRGTHGFGYDPIFHLPTQNLRLAEIPPHQKNQLSHRSRALENMLPQIEKLVSNL